MPTTSEARPDRERVRGPGKVPIQLQVNGALYSLEVEPRRSLLDVLRVDLHLTGTKKVCDMGDCGACTVILDDKTVYSCMILAIECEGHEILTIEGLSEGDELEPIQQAFVEHDAFQCGFCTPGQIMSVRALLDHNPNPTSEEIRRAVSGNICRCGAYLRIFEAAEAAAEVYAAQRQSPLPDRGTIQRELPLPPGEATNRVSPLPPGEAGRRPGEGPQDPRRPGPIGR